jgi:hypothetical protein
MRGIKMFIVLLASVLVSSCKDPVWMKMHTTISSDGTCKREVSYAVSVKREVADSLRNGEMKVSPIPKQIDTTSCKSYETEILSEGGTETQGVAGRENERRDTVMTKFTFDYETVEQMGEKIPLRFYGWDKSERLKSETNVEKWFRWFYTDYEYSETYAGVGDIFPVQMTDYLSQEEASYWCTGLPNLVEGLSGAEAKEKLDAIEKKVNKWGEDAEFLIYFDYIVSHYDSISNPPVSRQRFVELKDSLRQFKAKGSNRFDEYFHTDAFGIFDDGKSLAGKGLEEHFMKLMIISEFEVSCSLSMPGRIVGHDYGVVKDNVLYYKLSGETMMAGDYTVTVRSREVNTWAYVVTILIVVVAVGSPLYIRRRRGK